MADGNAPTLHDEICDQLRLGEGRMTAPTVRLKLRHHANLPMPRLLAALDALVNEGRVERLTDGVPRALYWLSATAKVAPTGADLDPPKKATGRKLQILNALPGKVSDIASRVATTTATIYTCLSQLKNDGLVVAPMTRGGEWRRAEIGTTEPPAGPTYAAEPPKPAEPHPAACTTIGARVKRAELEHQIDQLCREYEKQTGCAVVKVNVRRDLDLLADVTIEVML